MSIGTRIREARKRKGLSQEELAKAINSTKQAIYKYESNIVTNIPPEKIEKMAAALSVSPSDLMGWPSIASLATVSDDCAELPPDLLARLIANGVTVSVGDSADELWCKISQLDELDRAKADAFVSGLLAAEKYQPATHKIKIAARGGGVKEITVTDSQLQQIIDLPEVTDLDDKN